MREILLKYICKERKNMRYVKLISFLLVIIGALNWGLVGVFNFDLVARLMGDMTVWSRIVYALVGAGGLVSLVAVAANDNSCF